MYIQYDEITNTQTHRHREQKKGNLIHYGTPTHSHTQWKYQMDTE